MSQLVRITSNISYIQWQAKWIARFYIVSCVLQSQKYLIVPSLYLQCCSIFFIALCIFDFLQFFRYTLKVHKKTHEGEKCFKCDLCPYSSISQRHLESHMLIHTDQKPYQCDQCDQSFRQKQLLKRHQNLYHNPAYVPPPPKEKTHECPECNRSFRHKGNLIRWKLNFLLLFRIESITENPTLNTRQGSCI